MSDFDTETPPQSRKRSASYESEVLEDLVRNYLISSKGEGERDYHKDYRSLVTELPIPQVGSSYSPTKAD